MFKRILIANRGEIACRVIRTCKRLGIETVAIYSSADYNALHVRAADTAVAIGGAPAAESYLAGERIIAEARKTGAEAIHPGYGFLAENSDFARACEAAGLRFIGPRPETIEKMGSKAQAKRLMESARVPVVPGYHGEDQDDDHLAKHADRIGYPLMLKPTAGGGGKGMRIVRAAGKFAENLESARREARNAFGDSRMILEHYVESPRHIEFQIFGDSKGQVIHLNERECSVQRRYQKIIEETPSPFLDEKTRAAMGAAAVEAARAVNYLGAGTVEFIVGADRSFYFMEMNTRLQVEHPVTEMVTGLDLVEWQLRIAAGEALPRQQADVRASGHAIEARVYAESPEKGFLPASGRAAFLRFPDTGARVRVDAGVAEGDTVSVHYDPMIAKVIVLGDTRGNALARLQQALAHTYVAGLDTNLRFLIRLAHHEPFLQGEVDTGYLDRDLDAVLAPGRETPENAFIAAALHHLRAREGTRHNPPADRHSPWGLADAWRAGPAAHQRVQLESDGQSVTIICQGAGCGYGLTMGSAERKAMAVETTATGVRFNLDGERREVTLARAGNTYFVNADAARWHVNVVDPLARAARGDADEHRVSAPMPGRIVAIKVQQGDAVKEGEELVVVEAMKMEISLRAPHDGKVASLAYAEGDFVEADAALIELE